MNLKERLEQVTAARVNRYNHALYVIEHPEVFEQLVTIAFSSNTKLAIKASWVLEFVCKDDLPLLIPFYEYFIKNLSQVKHPSVKRPISRILFLLEEEKQKNNLDIPTSKKLDKEIISNCFDWLIGNDKVAVKCYSMRILTLVGKKHDWVYPELELILQQNIPLHSAAYKAAAKDVLKKIRK